MSKYKVNMDRQTCKLIDDETKQGILDKDRIWDEFLEGESDIFTVRASSEEDAVRMVNEWQENLRKAKQF